MKLILLRHEDREDYPGFYSNLTENGFNNSIKLIKKLNKLDIDFIYSSPFVRTLQTIYPFAIYSKKKVNVDFGLSEYRHNPYFIIENQIYTLADIEDENLLSIVNKKYKTIFRIEDFNYILLEFEYNLEERVKKFMDKLINNKKYKNKTILLVSHKGVINMIKKLYFKKNHDLSSNFLKGKYEIYKI